MSTSAVPFHLRTARRFERFGRKPRPVEAAGRPRAEITAPISPSGVLSDAVVFEQAADANVKLHLPRFRIRTTQTSYDLRVLANDGRWSVRIGVEPYPAEELGEAARSAALEFTVSAAVLTYPAPPLDRRIQASEIIPDDRGLTIGFDVDLPGKDELLWALASEHGVTLELSRALTVAVPVAPTAAAPTGILKYLGSELIFDTLPVRAEPGAPEPNPGEPHPEESAVRVGRVRDHRTRIRDHRAGVATTVFTPFILNEAFLAQPAKPVVAAQPTAVAASPGFDTRLLTPELVGLQPGVATMIAPKWRLDSLSRFQDIAFDAGQVVVAQPAADAAAAEVRYRETTTVLPATLKLRLQPDAHPEIFGGGHTRAPRLRSVRVTHRSGRSHVYLHDESRPETFYYLPDGYCLARTQASPMRPAVVVRVDQGDEGTAPRAAMTFMLRPRLDHDRLREAVAELGQLLPPPQAGEPEPAVVLEPVQADAELTLGLPPGGVLETPPLDLVNGFLTQAFFPLDEFQRVFAALASESEVEATLRGNVEVMLGEEAESPTSAHVLIPVDIRFGSAGGDVLTVDDAQLADGAMALTIRNSSESPVRIDALPLRMTQGGVEVAASAEGLVLPVELAAGAETSFTVTPSSPLEGEGDVDVLVDVDAVVPLPDLEAILALVLDNRIAQESSKQIRVVTTAAKLAGEGDEITDLFVEFDGSDDPPVHLDAATTQMEASVPVPLVDVLLRRDSAGYRFRQTILRSSGDHRDDQWRISNASLLVVPVS